MAWFTGAVSYRLDVNANIQYYTCSNTKVAIFGYIGYLIVLTLDFNSSLHSSLIVTYLDKYLSMNVPFNVN